MTLSVVNTMVVDLAATHHVFYKDGAGRNIDIETLAGSLKGSEAGNIITKTRDSSGTGIKIKFKKAIISSEAKLNLLSLTQLRADGWDFRLADLELQDPTGRSYPLALVGGLVIMTVNMNIAATEKITVNYTDPTDDSTKAFATVRKLTKGKRLMHLRLAHFSDDKILQSVKAGANFGVTEAELHNNHDHHHGNYDCAACKEGKAHKPSKQRSTKRAKECGDLIHTDIKGPLPTGAGDERWIIHFTDDHSRYTHMFALKAKSDAPKALDKFLTAANRRKHVIREIRSDQAAELIKGDFKKTLERNHIASDPTAPYDPAAGGRHERILDTIWTHLTATLHAAPHVNFKYWPVVLPTIAEIYNNLIHRSINAIPAKLWAGQVTNLTNLRTIGSTIYMHVPKQFRGAHQPRARRYIYMGFVHSTASLVLDPETDQVMTRGHQLQSVETADAMNRIAELDEVSTTTTSIHVQGGEQRPNQDDKRTTNLGSDPKGGAQTTTEATTTGNQSKGGERTETQMVDDDWWEYLNSEYGPFNVEACSSPDGSNARLEKRFSDDDSFLNWWPTGPEEMSVWLNPPYSRANEFLEHAVKIADANQNVRITALVPRWHQIDMSEFHIQEQITHGTKLFKGEEGIKWIAQILTLGRNEDKEMPTTMKPKTLYDLKEITILKCSVLNDADFSYAVVKIATEKGIKLISLSSLLTTRPDLWDEVIKHLGFHPKLLKKVTCKTWPDDVGITTAYDADKGFYEIAYPTGEFHQEGEADVIECKKGTVAKAMATLTPETANESPVMTKENLDNIFIPATSDEMLRMKDGALKDLYLEARSIEINNLENQGVFDWAKLPKGQRTIKAREIFDLKWDTMAGELDKAKCRIIAQGFAQRPGLDFSSTYSSTPKLSTSRLFLHQVLNLGMSTAEFDITAAYLHAPLSETIYLRPPKGLERYDTDGNELVWRMRKSLYGLKQSGKNWMDELFGFLKNEGLRQSEQDTSLWTEHNEQRELTFIMFIHTDDGKVGYLDEKRYEDFSNKLRKRFKVGTEKRGIDRMFNIKIEFSDDKVAMTQQRYIEDLARAYNMKEDPKVDAPMSTEYKCTTRELTDEEHKQMTTTKPYLSLLSALMWVARCTRPDISSALAILGRANSNPNPSHWRALMKVLKYLFNTRTRGVTIRKTDRAQRILTVLVDASHANEATTMRSISGQFILIGNTVIDWTCKHQNYVTLHSSEAEIVSSAAGMTHLIYWEQMLKGINYRIDHSHLRTDSSAALQILDNPKHDSATKHLRTKLLFAREQLLLPNRTISHIDGTRNPADMLTKPLSGPQIRRLLDELKHYNALDTRSAFKSTRKRKR